MRGCPAEPGIGKTPNYQSFNNDTLAGKGAVLVFLREARIRDDGELKTMRPTTNARPVEIAAQTGLSPQQLQGLSNVDSSWWGWE